MRDKASSDAVFSGATVHTSFSTHIQPLGEKVSLEPECQNPRQDRPRPPCRRNVVALMIFEGFVRTRDTGDRYPIPATMKGAFYDRYNGSLCRERFPCRPSAQPNDLGAVAALPDLLRGDPGRQLTGDPAGPECGQKR